MGRAVAEIHTRKAKHRRLSLGARIARITVREHRVQDTRGWHNSTIHGALPLAPAAEEPALDQIPEVLLEAYKDQGVSVERGFRFLKDPLFYAESLYLKSPQRIMALLMVMTLSLLMYSLAEMRLRAALAERERHIWDQKNKPTQRPTIRWVFMI